jgi:pimeloyl-ACP methyl ester carboxylesterase
VNATQQPIDRSPLILISGLLSNEYVWLHQVSHLSQLASISVACPTENTPEKMVQAILNKVPPVFALAGHSMGGWVCLEIMRVAPARVSKLCLLNTTARSDSDEKRAKREEMILGAKQGRFHEIVEEMASYFVYNPHLKEGVKEMFLSMGAEIFIQQEEAMISRRECLSILPSIGCPTLVIHAAKDKIFSLEEHEELATKIPNAKLAVIEDSGHMSPLEMPQAITTLLHCWLSW